MSRDDPPAPLLGGGVAAARGCCSPAATSVVADPAAPRKILFTGEDMHRGLQRALTDRDALAPEFRARAALADLPLQRHAQSGHARVRRAARRSASPTGGLTVGGLVARPLSLSLADLRAIAAARADHPPRLRRGVERDRQVAGAAARRRAAARRACATRRATSSSPAPTSTAARPITNRSTWSTRSTRRRSSPGRSTTASCPSPTARPCRLRVERQLGYKHAKYLMRDRRGRQPRRDRQGARAAIGRITSTTIGTRASRRNAAVHRANCARRARC